MSYNNASYSQHSLHNALIFAAFVAILAVMLAYHLSGPQPLPLETYVIKGKHANNDVIIARNAAAERRQTLTHQLSYSFADEDLDLYRAAFAFQDKAEWEKANDAISQIQDDVLIGALLQQRFLHKDYTSDYYELAAWLLNFSDMPDSDKILHLASRKKPSKVRLPHVETYHDRLGGVGTRDGMGGRAMPRAWKAGLDAWMEGEYHTAAQIFKTVSQARKISPWHKSAAHFWAYRSASRAGYNHLAQHHLIEASAAPFTLYGALARNALGQHTFKKSLPAISPELEAIPAVKRAAAYAAIDMPDMVNEELRLLYTRLPHEQRQQLISVAASLNMPALQIRMSQMLYKDPTRSNVAAYPIPKWVASYDMLLDPALLYAIGRQESGFHTKAKSRAGARGIMQVMPATAKYIYKKHELGSRLSGNKPFQTEDLYDPQLNFTIAQHYLKYLSEKEFIQGNMIHMVAAYNAGPSTIKGWQKRFKHVSDPLLYVELMPFKETRQYVKQVLTNYVIYSELLNGRSQQSIALLQGSWPVVPTKAPDTNPQRLAELQ